MQPNISQHRINTVDRDRYREKSFKDAYGLDTKIRYTSINDKNWNWVQAICNFKDSAGKNYGLIEYFKEGDDNSTDYVEFEYETPDGLKRQRFDRYIDAELALVDLIRNRLNGNS